MVRTMTLFYPCQIRVSNEYMYGLDPQKKEKKDPKRIKLEKMNKKII